MAQTGLVKRTTPAVPTVPAEQTALPKGVALAATRGLTVTAEGVEDSATWDRLADMGVEQAQGYLIARPLLAIAVPVWLRRWPRRQAAD